MSQLYRLVYAIRCPFTDWRVPVGAILQTKTGIQIVEGELARDEGALGIRDGDGAQDAAAVANPHRRPVHFVHRTFVRGRETIRRCGRLGS